jgi:ABC-type Fe3+-hydroxamate transport system substrate-binding protein
MTMKTRLLTWLSAVAVALLATTGSAAPAQRIVSMIPAVTEMLFAIGDGPRVVGVTNYDRFPPEVSRLVVSAASIRTSSASAQTRPGGSYNTQVELKQRLIVPASTTVRAPGACRRHDY